MMKAIKIIPILAFVVSCTGKPGGEHTDLVLPTPRQVEYQQMEVIGFVHFNMNTFTNKEWGYGDEKPELFNPSALSTDQWAKIAAGAGMKELILTAKHHDGFCLWPSRYTAHSIKNSPYKNGRGDIVEEFAGSCRKYGLKVGLYLSPWDRNHADYGNHAYVIYYRNQLRELLGNYGEISEVWFDGANGGDGYYGGANEERRIDRETYYGWDTNVAIVRELQPGALIFSDAGPDVRWIGNEHGIAGETFWSTINADSLIIGDSERDYLNTGDENGNTWLVGQCDVSIRPGWFYHKAEDTLVKSPRELVDLYYKSVGRNALLLLNIPPTPAGLFHENDARSLMEFRSILDETFRKDLALGAKVNRSNMEYAGKRKCAGSSKIPGDGQPLESDRQNGRSTDNGLLDESLDTYLIAREDSQPAYFELEFPEPVFFDRIIMQEPIAIGQRIKSFRILADIDGRLQEIASGTTIGHKRLLRIDGVSTGRVKVLIEDYKARPAIARFGLFKASPRETID